MRKQLREKVKELARPRNLLRARVGAGKLRKALSNMRASVRTVKTKLEKLEASLKLHRHRIRDFKPNVEIWYERGNFRVQTARNGEELEQCLRLRFEVFHREFMGRRRTYGVDIDHMDFICDHLMIVDTKQNQVVGTYRLNSSKFTDEFYSAGEFSMDDITDMSGSKLELGRACITREHRTGIVIALLWRGISDYLKATEAKILFGCASVKTMDPLEIVSVAKWLADNGFTDETLKIKPTRKYRFRSFDRLTRRLERRPAAYDQHAARELIPNLFMAYLKAGAKVSAEPALDKDFQCIDFLMVMKVDQMKSAYAKKYADQAP